MTRRRRLDRTLRPGLWLVLGLVAVILVGSILLSLPGSSSGTDSHSWLDALFTSTSAACVTGLIVFDTGSDLSFSGQLITLILIQLGGLGIMSASGLVSLFLGRGLGMRESRLVHDLFDDRMRSEAGGILRLVASLTLTVEAIGAVVLWFGFADVVPDSGARVWAAIFHSVSAFCNAGFSLFTDSLIGVANNGLVVGTITALLILGGLGFAVIVNVVAWGRGRALASQGKRINRPRLSVQARVVLRLSAGLLVGGTLAIFLIERSGSFSDPGLLRDFGQAFFQSATCRTAGFNTMDLTTMGPASLIVMMVLMAIGAAPGSTAGGLKLTTVAVLWANLRAIVAGDDQARLFDREIPRLVVRRSFMILTSWILALILAVLLLLISGAGPLESVLFESVSALGTVGLSLGLTPDLSILGKVTVILLMFLGRLGPLAVAYGLVATSQSSTVRYPETTLMVG